MIHLISDPMRDFNVVAGPSCRGRARTQFRGAQTHTWINVDLCMFVSGPFFLNSHRRGGNAIVGACIKDKKIHVVYDQVYD